MVDFFELLNYHDHQPTLDHLVEIRKQGALEVEEPMSEPKERTMTVLKLTEGRGVTETGIRVFRAVIRASSEQQKLNKKL